MLNDVSQWYSDIREFMTAAGQTVPEKPEPLCEKDAVLRARLIMEEALETIHALGVEVHVNHHDDIPIAMDNLDFYRVVPTHMLGAVDGCCDIIVVTLGTLVSLGLPDNPFMTEVNQNNLTKVKPRVYIKEGKIQKPPGYQPPQLSKLLLQCYEASNEA